MNPYVVRFAFDTPVSIAKLDTQGIMFVKIPIGDQVLHIPWLPKPGGMPYERRHAMNDCDEPSCPCEGWPTLSRLYAVRAASGLAVQEGLWSEAKYDGLRQLVRAHELAWRVRVRNNA